MHWDTLDQCPLHVQLYKGGPSEEHPGIPPGHAHSNFSHPLRALTICTEHPSPCHSSSSYSSRVALVVHILGPLSTQTRAISIPS